MGRKKIGIIVFGLMAFGLLLLHADGKAGVRPAGEWVKVEVNPDSARVVVDGNGKAEEVAKGVVKYTSPSGNLTIPLAEGEAVYGLTERLVSDIVQSEREIAEVGGLDRRGEIVSMFILPTYSVYSPFFISSRRYAMYVEGSWPGEYDIGKSRADEMRVSWETDPKKGFSCYFIFGDSYDQILDKYTGLIGRPFLPPKWAFTPWRWRDQHAIGKPALLDGVLVNAQLAEDVLMYEKLGIPAGVYMIDRPWAQGKMGYGNLTFDTKRFPNPKKMIEILHRRGYRVITWGAPWAIGRTRNDFGYEARKKGYLVPGSFENLDYSNPEVMAWHQDKIKNYLREYGVDGWKLDRGEEDIPSKSTDVWFDGRNGREMRNEYPRLYIRTFYEATSAVRGQDFVLMPRPGYAGTQQWSSNWGGDIPGTELGLRAAIIAGQRAAFMGFAVWGTDTGGYVEFRDREVFARWIEFSTFCPLMEVGGKGNHAPWDMPKEPKYDQEMIDIVRKYHKLRMALLDYIYAQAELANQTGAPIIRPLVFDHPDDPRVRDMWDEYKFGPELLVAPIWKSGVRAREVYLPAGQWTDFWDRSKTWQGPATINYAAALDTVPLFIRGGSAGKFAGTEKIE